MKKKILIVEDEQDISTPIAFRLEKKGYDVTTTTDGEKGLALARSIQPDLMILDLTLPSLPGEEVCKTIREDNDKSFANTPIIMLTAKSSQVDKIIGKVIGANAYITKPFEAESLMDDIQQIVGI